MMPVTVRISFTNHSHIVHINKLWRQSSASLPSTPWS